MKTIYIDSEFRCHTVNDGTMRAVETEAFEDNCDAFIEGCRFVPLGESWTREDSVVFHGEMVSLWKPDTELEIVQREYEREKLADAENALAIMFGGEPV